MFLLPFGWYRSACFVIIFVFILYRCCSHFSCCSFIPFTMFSAPLFYLIPWSFSLSSFVIPSKCLKNFICAASKRRSSLFFSAQASLPNFNAALAVMLWIFNFVSLFICFPKCLLIARAKAAWPLGSAVETAADGRGSRRKSSALKLGPFG